MLLFSFSVQFLFNFGLYNGPLKPRKFPLKVLRIILIFVSTIVKYDPINVKYEEVRVNFTLAALLCIYKSIAPKKNGKSIHDLYLIRDFIKNHVI